MDGDLKPTAVPAGDAGEAPRPAPPPRTARWFVIVGTLLALVLGGLYEFNSFREQAVAAYFAGNRPPPAQIAAVTAGTASVPRYAGGIGSLAAIHQVTVTPEVGGRVAEIVFTAGATVSAGEKLVQLNDAPDRGDLAAYEAQLRMNEISLARSKELARHSFASQETVDRNQMQYDQVQGQIAKTEAVIAQKLVRAPFAGRLGTRQIEVGQYLTPGAPIVTLTDLSQLYVNFTLPSQMRSQIKIGQSVNVSADAYRGRVFVATITTIEPQIRADTRTMSVQATMGNPDELLLPGMFVDASVVLPEEPDRVVLPETAVDYTLYGDSVFVIREDGKDGAGHPILKAFRTSVKTGARWDNKVAILSGLKPGEQVVAAGQIKVQSGAQVVVTGNPTPQPPADPTPQ